MRNPFASRIEATGSVFILLLTILLVLCSGNRLAAAEGTTLRIGGTGGALGTMQIIAAAFTREHPEISVSIIPHLGTRGGINGVRKGAIDIGLAGRGLTPQELAEGLQNVPYARSPLVFVTSHPSVQTSLTYEMIAGIYRGEIKRWPDGTTIRPILRPTGDIDILMLKAISPELQRAVQLAEAREGMIYANDDQENCDLLEKIPGAFGTSTLTQITSEKRSLTILPLNGLRPDSGVYPHEKVFHMVTGPRSAAVAVEFIAFVQSAAGRAILSRSGNYLAESP